MSMGYIRSHYGVPAKRGGLVEYTGGAIPRRGTIRSANGHYLMIHLDGERRTRTFHPTWELRYVED